MLHNSKPGSESGNVFLFILLGIVLFAALAFTISRSMRSETTTMLSGREAVLAAAEILDYAGKLQRGINRMRRKSISENDISFSNPQVAGYAHSPVQPDSNKIFSKSGGHVLWQSPVSGVNNGSDWVFTGATCINGIGTGPAGCDTDSDISNEELLAVLPNLDQSVCEEINDRLNISSIPADTGGDYSSTKFTGTFADGTKITLATTYDSACYSNSGDYHFYTVLITR